MAFFVTETLKLAHVFTKWIKNVLGVHIGKRRWVQPDPTGQQHVLVLSIAPIGHNYRTIGPAIEMLLALK